MSDVITIADLEVRARVGVPDEERAVPQRLLLTVEMDRCFAKAAVGDDIEATIDYHAVAMALTDLAENGEWRLIEKLADEAAALVLAKFQPDYVRVEVKKFILPETRHVSVRIERRR
ncbi:MAG: dihydroneopterin aldolase [Verrucomicrobia subdivision 3 bacterium]|nr:dihydroneopterin aldolase [Limisphaerales bacterium]